MATIPSLLASLERRSVMGKAPSGGQARVLAASFLVDTRWDELGVNVQPFIDLPPKVRGERFAEFLRSEEERLATTWKEANTRLVEPESKFRTLVDLGPVTVPEYFVHEKCLDVLPSLGRPVHSVASEITDKNFANPSRKLKPGDRLWIRAHKQILYGTTTKKERMAFLAALGSHHVGAQGVTLLFDKNLHRKLPQGYRYISYDEKERLMVKHGLHWLPTVVVKFGSHDSLFFNLTCFEQPMGEEEAFFSFCDVPEGL